MDLIINVLEVSDFVATLFKAVYGALFMPTILYCYLPQYVDSKKLLIHVLRKVQNLM